MANPLLMRTGIVAGLGTAAVLVFFASATGVLPLRALISLADTTPPPAAPTPATTPATAAANPVEKVALVAAETAPPTLTDNDVVAGTFAALPAHLQKPALADGPKSAETRMAAATPLSKRTVRVITVKPDGTPDFAALSDNSGDETVAQAYAEPHRPPVRYDIPALDAAEQIGAGKPPALPAPQPAAAKVASVDPAPVVAGKSVNSGVILGAGANVRSAPSKGNNKVLFALPGGTSVKLGESRNGWYRITDPKGRTGWVYRDYVKR